jgi:hypothetical protein
MAGLILKSNKPFRDVQGKTSLEANKGVNKNGI